MSNRYKGGVISATPPDTTTSKGIWTLTQQMQAKGASTWPALPGAPTIGTASIASGTSVSVPFTAPACAGYPATITGYLATSTPGCITGTASSSPITVSGLTTGTAYTFKVKAQNATGYGPCSAASNSVTPIAQGQQAYACAGTFSWVAPAGVTSVSVVAIGGGGGARVVSSPTAGGGGGLGYTNNISVTPGCSYSVVVGARGTGGTSPTNGGDSSFVNTGVVRGGGGKNGSCGNRVGGTFTGTGGGCGGLGGAGTSCEGGGGGGAGGYAGTGGAGATSPSFSGTAGAGGGGGGGGGRGRGGSTGTAGQGCNGAGRSGSFQCGGTGSPSAVAGGGGGGGNFPCCSPGRINGFVGAVRVIWPGTSRSFPSTNTGDV